MIKRNRFLSHLIHHDHNLARNLWCCSLSFSISIMEWVCVKIQARKMDQDESCSSQTKFDYLVTIAYVIPLKIGFQYSFLKQFSRSKNQNTDKRNIFPSSLLLFVRPLDKWWKQQRRSIVKNNNFELFRERINPCRKRGERKRNAWSSEGQI